MQSTRETTYHVRKPTEHESEQDVGETTRLQRNICWLFDGKIKEEIILRYTTRKLIVSTSLLASGAISKPLN